MVTKTKLYINGKDAEATWGLRLDGEENRGYDALVGQKTYKEPVTNKNVTAEGEVVVCGTGLLDSRTVSVPVHIVAKSYTDFKAKKTALESYLGNGEANVTPKGRLNVSVRREWKVPGTSHTAQEEEFSSVMYCLGINSYTEFSQVQQKRYVSNTDTWSDIPGTGYGIAKFVLVLFEPNEPTI